MQKFSGPLYGFLSIIMCLIIVEIFLRIMAPVPDPYYKYDCKPVNQYISIDYPPYFRIETEIEKGLTDEGKHIFSRNNVGFRGDRLEIPKPDNEFRIIIIGPSPVEGYFIDDSQALNTVLQRELNNYAPEGFSVKVYNASTHSARSDDLISMLVHRVVHLEPDMFIVFSANDIRGIRHNMDSLHLTDEETAPKNKFPMLNFFATEFQIPRRIYYFYKNVNPSEKDVLETRSHKSLLRERVAKAKSAPITDRKLTIDYRPFIDNLRTIIGVAKAHDIELVLTTTQMTWNSTVDPETDKWQWMTYNRLEKVRYREDVMDEASEKYNEIVRQLSKEYSVPIFDVKKIVPKSTKYFLDDAHYSVYGTNFVGMKLSSFILQEELIRR